MNVNLAEQSLVVTGEKVESQDLKVVLVADMVVCMRGEERREEQEQQG